MDTPFFRVFFLCYKQVTTKKSLQISMIAGIFLLLLYWQANRL